MHLYVHLVPGDGLQDGILGPLNVQAEVVDGGVAEGQEDGVEGQALQPEVPLPLLQGDARHGRSVAEGPRGDSVTKLMCTNVSVFYTCRDIGKKSKGEKGKRRKKNKAQTKRQIKRKLTETYCTMVRDGLGSKQTRGAR